MIGVSLLVLPQRGAAAPLTCTPQHKVWQFNSSNNYSTDTWQKHADGCQSVWMTVGKTTWYYVLNSSNNIMPGTVETECVAGVQCQLWPSAKNNVSFYIIQNGAYTVGANIYF
jgi:hypothetical protein